jgi:glutaredoxin-related protein
VDDDNKPLQEMTMTRTILDPAHLHAAIKDTVASFHADLIHAVQTAVASDNIVIVGMRQNPFPKRARKALDAIGMSYRYLEYGSYFSEWRPRLALKMWSGWPTFPMVFVKGVLIGGASELSELIKNGELKRMLST